MTSMDKSRDARRLEPYALRDREDAESGLWGRARLEGLPRRLRQCFVVRSDGGGEGKFRRQRNRRRTGQ